MSSEKKFLRFLPLVRRFGEVQFNPASSTLLPCYSFLAKLDDDEANFDILKQACSSAIIKLMYFRQAKTDPKIYLASPDQKGASQIPIDLKYVKVQLAMIISEVCYSLYNNIPAYIAFDNAIVTNANSGSLFKDYNFDTFSAALTGFVDSLNAILVKVDDKFFEKSEKLVDEVLKLTNIVGSTKRRATEIELIFGMLASLCNSIVNQLSTFADFTTSNVRNCESVQLPEILDHDNYVSVCTSLAVSYYAARMMERERDYQGISFEKLVDFDKTGRLSFKSNFPELFADELINSLFSGMTQLASEFKDVMKALAVSEDYMVKTLAIFTSSTSTSLSEGQKILCSATLSREQRKMISLEKRIEDLRVELQETNETVGNGFATLVELINTHYKPTAPIEFIGRFKAICGFNNNTPTIGKITDAQIERDSLVLLSCSVSRRRKRLFSSKFMGEPKIAEVLPIDINNDSYGSLSRNRQAEAQFGVPVFLNRLSDADTKGGTSYNTSVYGVAIKADDNLVRTYAKAAFAQYIMYYDETEHLFTMSCVESCLTLKPPRNALNVIFVGTSNIRAVSGVSYQFIKVDCSTCDLVDLLFGFYAGEVDNDRAPDLYRERIKVLTEQLTTRPYFERIKFVDQLWPTVNDEANNAGVFGLLTVFGKKALNSAAIAKAHIVNLPHNVTTTTIFANEFRSRSEPLDPVRLYSFVIPDQLLPAARKAFENGTVKITGPNLRSKPAPIYEIEDVMNGTYKITVRVHLRDTTNHVGKISRIDESSDKLFIFDTYESTEITSDVTSGIVCGVNGGGVIPTNQCVRDPMFFDSTQRAIENISNWVHGVFVSYIIRNNPKLKDAFIPLDESKFSEVLLENLSEAVAYLQKEYDPDTILDCKWMNYHPVSEFIAAWTDVINNFSLANVKKALALGDIASYGEAGDINLFVPVTLRECDRGWIKMLASGQVCFVKRPENFTSVELSSLIDYVPEVIGKVISKQIVADLNNL